MARLTKLIKENDRCVGVRMGDIEYKVFSFADDLVLVAEAPKHLQRMLDEVYRFAGVFGIEINTSKTKVLTFGRYIKFRRDWRWYVNGEEIENVKETKYLGVWFSYNGSFKKHMKAAKAKAMIACREVTQIVKKLKISNINLISNLWNNIIRASLSYCTIALLYENTSTLETVKARYYKEIFNLPTSVKTDALYKCFAINSVDLEIKRNCLKFLSDSSKKCINLPLQNSIRYAISKKISFVKIIEKWGIEVGMPMIIDCDPNKLREAYSIFYDKYVGRLNNCFYEWNFIIINEPFWLPFSFIRSRNSLYEKSLFLKIIFDGLNIKGTRYNYRSDKICEKCGLGAIESFVHFFVICPYYDNLREQEISELTSLKVNVKGMVQVVKNMLNLRNV